jgi:hypothetical protein
VSFGGTFYRGKALYSSCLFCARAFDANQAVEALPLGRRIVFDALRGRLWVVCRCCGRWNLSPFETRWEAIEQCERLYLATRLRVATDHIGLARVAEGTELVCIGNPGRTEFASWRYGDQFGQRRRRSLLYAGLAATGFAAAAAGGWTLGVGVQVITQVGYYAFHLARRPLAKDVRVHLPREGKPDLVVESGEINEVYLRPDPEAGWALMVWREEAEYILTGDTALRTASLLLPYINRGGGSAAQVNNAVRYVEHRIHPFEAFSAVAGAMEKAGPAWQLDKYRLTGQPAFITLALEMVAHEEQERRALEGELALLEHTWREAEAVASIADRLATSPATEALLVELRKSGTPAAEPLVAADVWPK